MNSLQQQEAPPAEALKLKQRASSLRPLLGVWKSRLPLVVVPVLAGLRQLSHTGFSSLSSRQSAEEFCKWEATLLLVIVVGTGYLRLPFSATWWLVLLAAFGLETRFLLGVATVLSLTVLLGWYGLRLRHPRATSALWGGARGISGEANKTLADAAAATGIPFACWCAWDLFVHGLPAALVLYWHGPWVAVVSSASSRIDEGRFSLQFHSGTVTSAAVLAALFLNLLWLLGLSASVVRTSAKREQHETARSDEKKSKSTSPLHKERVLEWLAETTDTVYRIAPKLPQGAWLWVYGSHWAACLLWMACLVLPHEALFIYGVCIVGGLTRQPFTNVWWFLFLSALHGALGYSARSPLLEGAVWCCGATTFVGWYGTQFLLPWVFDNLTRAWVVEPAEKLAPPRIAKLARAFADFRAFSLLMRIGDMFLHFFPTLYALWLFRPTALACVIALPTNLIWLGSTGATQLAHTNRLYGVEPEPPGYLWTFIFGSHWVFCSTVLVVVSSSGHVSL